MRQHFEEQGIEPPADLFPPELLPEASIYVDALRILAGDRQLSIGGMGGIVQGRIPFASIDRYAARQGIDDLDAFARFVRILSAIDTDEVSYLNAKANKKTS